MHWALGSNSRDSSSGVRPDRTNPVIWARNSAGYGFQHLGKHTSSRESEKVCTVVGQLRLSFQFFRGHGDFLAASRLGRPLAARQLPAVANLTRL